MKFYFLSFVLLFCMATELMAQDKITVASKLPYREIPTPPEIYSAKTVTARMIDGLGFRYYWATEGLRKEDLQYKPGKEARTCEETLDHILGLSRVIYNSVYRKPNVRKEAEKLTFEQKRQKTLENLKAASDLLKAPQKNSPGDYNIVFGSGENTQTYPFWNLLNGPLADAIWHTGQVVSFRRASGNPFDSRASVFTGKVKNKK